MKLTERQRNGLLAGLCLLLIFAYGPETRRARRQPDKPGGARLAQLAQQQPLGFERASGADGFQARGAGYRLGLTENGARLELRAANDGNQQARRAARRATHTQPATVPRAAVLQLELPGAQPHPRLEALDALPGVSNYLLGADARHWQTGVPRYAKVAYRGVYPGVDLVFYGRQQELEYDFVVAPGADPRQIKLRFTGAADIQLDGQGALHLRTLAGEVVQHAPVVYQETINGRTKVPGRYVLNGAREVSFAVGDYDAQRPLVLDPVLSYATFFGNSNGVGNWVAVDPAGNAYVVGTTSATDFLSLNPAQPSAGGGTDTFVTKFNAVGVPVYSTYLGGAGTDSGRSIAVDADGNAYIAGRTTSANFPVVNAFQNARRGTSDGFVAKLNVAGNGLLYSTYLGGSSSDEGFSLAVDTSRNAYVTGDTSSSDFPTTAGAFRTRLGGSFAINAFVTKFNADGRALGYSTYLGGSDFDFGFGIAVDAGGNAWVVGEAESADFPTTPGAVQTRLNGFDDAFITKLNPAGTALVFSTLYGGDDYDVAYGLTTDAAGAVYVAGETGSRDFPTTASAFQRAYGGAIDLFGLKLSATGALVFATYLGGSGSESTGPTGSIAADSLGNSYVMGLTTSTNWPTLNPLQAEIGGGGVYKSATAGNGWSANNNGLLDAAIVALAAAPTNPTTLYAGTFGNLFRSVNGGSSWNTAATGLPDDTIQAIAVDPATPATLYAATLGNGVFKSTNGGDSWSAINQGLTGNLSNVFALAIDRSAPMTLYAGGNGFPNRVFKSTNGGSSWTGLSSGPGFTVNALSIDPATPATIYAGTSSGGIFKSTNGGSSWSAVNTGLTTLIIRAIAIDPATPATLYAATSGGVFKSTNSGNNWIAVNTGLGALDIRALVIDPSAPATLYAGTGGNGVFKSTNGGGSWSASNTGLSALAVRALVLDPLAPATIYAGTNGQDALVAKLSPTGALLFSTYLGGNSTESANSIATDANGNVYVTGSSSSPNFPVTAGALQDGLKSTGSNAFLVKLSEAFACTLACTATAPGTGTAGLPVAFNANVSGCAGATTQVWDFGDGAARVAQSNPAHVYFAPGSYTWTLATLNGGAAACTKTGTVTISGRGVANVSAASFTGDELARESIVAAFGANLATASQAATGTPLPTMLAGTTVRITDSAGLARLAPLFFVAPGQINYLIPADLAPGRATVTVTSGAAEVALGSLPLVGVAPGLFTANADGRGVPAAVALRVRSTGAQSFETVARFDQATNRFVSVPLDLGPEAEQVFLLLFGTGLRGRSALSSVSVKLGPPAGVDGPVSFAGAQGDLAGLDQLNVGPLPRSLAGRGEVDVVLTIDGKAANTVRVSFK
ncbi:MAG: SBBP repeat-containing protein [Acidobacteria bacterium]|nr:SBBP repeat-containing protein [Acidobacteriota bacterium]MBI3426525.1 SBBP repeat-containing protein [Acidobacteriota bacterium]